MPVRYAFILLVALFAACSSTSEKANKAFEEIKKLESTMQGSDSTNFSFDEKKARDVMAAYEEFAKNFPDDKLSPEMLLKSADLHRALKEHDVALNIYKRIETDYPDFDKMPQVIFLEGFVYENELFRLEKAKERYEVFLNKYPDHELADDVTFSLKNLGKTPEEIIREFEQQQPPSDSVPS